MMQYCKSRGGTPQSAAHRNASSLGQPLKHLWINSQRIASELPNFLKEINIDFGTSDKIFSSQWLSEKEILVGSKCNKLTLVDFYSRRKLDIPLLSKPGATVPSSTNSCGIHSVKISPGSGFVATGGRNPNYLAVYRLPHIIPLALGEFHTDWIFDVQWLSDNLLITGSRDSTMGLWSIDSNMSHHNGMELQDNSSLAECVPVVEPVFTFSNLHSEHNIPAPNGERVRSLAYCCNSYELASLQANPCGANLHIWDVFAFQQISKTTLPHCAENVCVEVDSEGSQLYAVGSRSHVTFIDPRQSPPHDIAGSVKSLDKECGVRSLQFNQQILSIGTGAGHLYFYDMRSNAYVYDNSMKSKPCFLTASQGWLRHDQTYQDVFSGLPRPSNALYTHCYSPLRTKIFTAGGPLPLGLYGNYASVWM